MINKFINSQNNSEFLCKTILGLERETMRTTNEGVLSQTSHPKSLGNPLNHLLIKTDFCEAQIEYSTKPSYRMKSVLKSLELLHHFTVFNVPENEFLWPFSMPPKLPENEMDIPLAYYGESWEGVTKTVYRRGLGFRYGRRMQTISGVHINISFSKYLMNWASQVRYREPLNSQTQSKLYLDTIRNFNRYSFILIFLFGASPVFDSSFSNSEKNLVKWKEKTKLAPFGTSIRLSELGYTSKVQNNFTISLNSLEDYVRDLKKYTSTTYPSYSKFNNFKSINPTLEEFKNWNQLNDYYLQIENEYYSLIRPKQIPEENKRLLDILNEKGIRYLEVRCMDIDPYSPIGVNEEALSFMEIFLLYCLLKESPPMNFEEKKIWDNNQETVVWYGRETEKLYQVLGDSKNLKDWFLSILPDLEKIADYWDNRVKCSVKGPRSYMQSLNFQKQKIEDFSKLPSQKILNELKNKNLEFLDLGKSLGIHYKKEWISTPLEKRAKQRLEAKVKESWNE